MAVSTINKKNVFRGLDDTRVVNHGTSNSITPTVDGVWVFGGTQTTGNPLPVIYVNYSGSVIATATGTNTSGDVLMVNVPVKAGETYAINAYRINVTTSKVFY